MCLWNAFINTYGRIKKYAGNGIRCLGSKGKRYRSRGAAKDKRGQIIGRVGIEKRPEIVEKRERFGDCEIDTIIGKNHQGAMVTINDRATGFLKMRKVESKESEGVKNAAIALLSEWKPFVHTITADNGKEFAQHQQIADALDIDFFFARPYHSWERGSNENLNGLIRQFIPKKTDFSEISDQYIQEIEDRLNQRPRKRLDYESPMQRLEKKLHELVAFIT